MKLVRNHFLDAGFLIDGKEVKKQVVSKLLALNDADLTVVHKISSANLIVAGPKRQKVKLATKLFSHTVAKAISRAGILGKLQDENWKECHDLFKLVI